MKRIKILQKVRVFWYKLLSTNKPKLYGTKIKQPVIFVGKGTIQIYNACIGYWPSPDYIQGVSYFEVRNESARLFIGDDTIINNNAAIIVERGTIEIGKRCMIGRNFNAVDSDFHGLTIFERNSGNHATADVTIKDDVFIGNDVTLLKGVSIGRGSVIGSSSVVTRSFPDFSVVAGNPAKLIRKVADY